MTEQIPETAHAGRAAPLWLGVAALLIGVQVVGSAAASGMVLFAGPLAPGAPLGVMAALAGTVLVVGALALFGGLSGAIGEVQDQGLAVLTATLAVTAAALPTGPEARVATALAIIVLASLTTGVLGLMLGALRLGQVLRYMPYAVLGGFLAATGWLLLTASLALAAEGQAGLAVWLALADPQVLVRALPTLGFAALLVAVSALWRHPGAGAVAIGLGVLGFHVALALAGYDLAWARERGLVLDLGAATGVGGLAELTALPSAVVWSTVAEAAPGIL
ncbi:MAG: SulP family inorganic anion transporter, partial [Pseudomonadota bacterium]